MMTSTVEATAADSRRILCVGLLCLDIVNICDCYPEEDSDVRAREQQWRSGGNAGNTSIVLSLIGRQCEFLGTLGHGVETDFAVAQLSKHGIIHNQCVYHNDCTLPTSYVTLSTANGSRTIVHYRNLPELSVEDFSKIDLSHYTWIHFEGRSPGSYSRMIEQVISYRKQRCHESREDERVRDVVGMRPGVSVELEKKGEDRIQLAPLADVVFLSKDYAQYIGYHTMEQTVIDFRRSTKHNAVVVCAWGDRGAAATDPSGKLYTSPSYPPPHISDTLGAGDTFNAAFIHKMSSSSSSSSTTDNNDTVHSALTYACQLAGIKCGISGFNGLANTDLTQTK